MRHLRAQDPDKIVPPDEELIRVIAEARASSNAVHTLNPGEITAALINYRAAQLIAAQLNDIAARLQEIEMNTRKG